MVKKILSFILIGIMAGTALSYNGNAFFDAVYAEETENTAETTDEAISGPAIVEESTKQSIENEKKEESPSKIVNPNSIDETTTPEPIRNTDLITNPYRGYSYSRLIKEINKLQAQYPDLIHKEYIGKTAGGRNIPLVKLGKGDRKILIIGSEHAREYVTTSLIMRSIDTYSKAYVEGKTIDGTSVKKILDKVTFYFVPMLNIDGTQIVMGAATSKDIATVKKYVGSGHYLKYKNLWKANLRGVDLNRNYPFRWSKGKNTKKRAYMEYRGTKKASEPEVKAIVKLCRNNGFAFMFTMHTRGQVIYWKDKYNDVVPGASTLALKVRSITKYRLMPTSAWSTCSGESAKWFRAVYNKPAFTIEITPNSLSYKKAVQKSYFNSYVWGKNKSLFLRTALITTPVNKFKVFLSAGKGKVSKRYINIRTGKSYGTLPNAKRRGYKFLGWYNSAGKKITSNSIAAQKKNTILYAKYRKK